MKKTVDVTNSQQQVSGFFRALGAVRQPIEIVLGGKPVAKLIPPEELSEAEKEAVIQKGWRAVQKARARNRGLPERDIAKIVDAAVRRVRVKKRSSPRSGWAAAFKEMAQRGDDALLDQPLPTRWDEESWQWR